MGNSCCLPPPVALPAMRKQRSGLLVHVSSAAGRVFRPIVGAPDSPGSSEVAGAIVTLIDTAPAKRPFRTVVSAPIQHLLAPYNATADALRPAVAQISTFLSWGDPKAKGLAQPG